MKVLILLDSYKETLSSIQASEIISLAIKEKYPKTSITIYPFADGGENTLDCFKYVFKKAKEKKIIVSSSCLSIKKEIEYLIYEDMAIIESAKIIGLEDTKIKNPFLTTTYGLGEVILDALDKNIRNFIITLGGTATSDGGAGMLSRLGIQFLNENDEVFIPTGGTLHQIKDISLTNIDPRLKECQFTLLSDVENPLLGKNGANYVFAKQKGAKDEDIPELEKNMAHYATKVSHFTKRDIASDAKMGAAGGLSFGFASFFKTKIELGGKKILSLYQIEGKIENYDLIITGEGKTDEQSFSGKCISIVSSIAKKHHVKVFLVSGYIEEDIKDKLKDIGVTDYLSIQKDKSKSFLEIKRDAKKDLYDTLIEYISEDKHHVLFD